MRKRKVDVGIDVGGTTCRVALIYKGREIGRSEFRMSGEASRRILGDFDLDMYNVVEALLVLLHRHHASVRSIGVCIAGKLARNGRWLTNSGNLVWWISRDFVEPLEQAFPHARIVAGNDAQAAGLAEALFNEELQGVDFAFIIWGTGIGGTVVRRFGKATKVYAGEPGHININPTGSESCPCGQQNCWERYVAGAGVCAHFVVTSAKELDDNQWAEVIDSMVVGCRALQVTHAVPVFVFGGGVASKQQAERQILSRLEAALQKELRIVDAPKIMLSKFGESAGTWGGYALTVHAGLTKRFARLRQRPGLAA